MPPLGSTLRNQLERTIITARDVAEAGAKAALHALAVDEPEPFAHMSPEDRSLRIRLRARGRQLGDEINGKHNDVTHLTDACAYEQWHRILFSRFLIENDLLIHPEYRVSMSIEELRELASDEGESDPFRLAAQYASRMLPQIFRADDPLLEVTFAPEHRNALQQLVADLPPDVFRATDSLGWVYQFWQSKRKDEVNRSEVKIGAKELPAVTQLFTEHYMVEFLLHNTLGAWWAGKLLSDDLLANAKSENDLRRAAAPPGLSFDYLRFVRDEDSGRWQPAAGTFDTWPTRAAELRFMDPCCGSGHFLVAALEILARFRMVEEGLNAAEACDAVLRENLHGLEIDERCTQIAAFALAFACWTFDGARAYRPLPQVRIACSGIAPNVKLDRWIALAGGVKDYENIMERLYTDFTNAPTLGSLIDANVGGDTGFLKTPIDDLPEKIAALLEASHERGDYATEELGVAAQGIAEAAKLLAGRYHLVATNVPYLTRGKQDETLRKHCEKYYADAKNDIATVFTRRILRMLAPFGAQAVVAPQNWLFLTSYRKLREGLLAEDTWRFVARLGPSAFQTPMWDFNVQLLVLSREKPSAGNMLRGVDVSAPRDVSVKAAGLRTTEIASVEQAGQLENPDARITLEEKEFGVAMYSEATAYQGLATADFERYGRYCWELKSIGQSYVFQQSTTESTAHFLGKKNCVFWENGIGQLASSQKARIQGLEAWKRDGVAVSQMRSVPVTLHTSCAFDNNTAVIVPNNPSHLPAIWCYCSSPEYHDEVRKIDQKLSVTNATLVKVPFDLDRWQKVAEEQYPNGLPKPYTNDPTQWIFHGHPCGSAVWDDEKKWTARGALRTDETVLQVAVARLLGYRWPAEVDPDMELAEEQRAWVNRCAELYRFTDPDGIACIPSVRGERPASERLRALLVAAYGSEWSERVERRLLEAAGYGGKTLDDYLRDGFFSAHMKLFGHRPFIWHIWDGNREGFHALVNYHKLDRALLSTLTYTYLGDWIYRQEAAAERQDSGADGRMRSARVLQEQLEKIAEGESPLDIFVRWKPLEKQPIGWEPDLNDGVRLNIRPFMTVDDVGKKGAGVLRDKPNIHWKKDRGKDVASAPWYHRFKGDRINDHHLTLDEKRSAREQAREPRND